MNNAEKALLATTITGEPDLLIRTHTRIDAGRWWRRTSVWLYLAGDELIVLAVARRRYVQRVPIADCGESAYCHGTGELLIAPAQDLRFSRLAISPSDALKVLNHINTNQDS